MMSALGIPKIVLAGILINFYTVPLFAQNYTGEPVQEESQVRSEEPIFNRGTVPEVLRQPQRGDESPRYPRDAVIGELGRGLAAEEAYRYARNLLEGVLSGNRESALLAGISQSLLEELFTGLAPLIPQKYRLGGGREEADGATSFLFRFIGRDMSLAGELYLQSLDGKWRLEDILVEEARALSEGGKNTYKFDFSPYERFF
ncbi:hypothetical protein LQZ19_09820 [Treponema primitia]|uniref:hypothetical protein n=1 Tax=Treponema primitia TaxID=88058 RepID=UPI00398140BB